MALLSAARALLQVQGELGLSGLDLPAALLEQPAAAPASAPRREPARGDLRTHPAVTAPAERAAAGEPLATLREEIGQCQRCKLAATRTTIVFGAGSPRARLMFLGEAPDLDEDLQGVPLVGAAGQLLDRMIAAMGLERRDVYIANIVKCRPPRNRDPEPEEVAACAHFLEAQIRAVQPEVIVTLGRWAVQRLLGDTAPLSSLRGQWREYDGIPVMPTFHPAYLLRKPEEKRPVWRDLQEVMGRLGLAAKKR